MVYAYTEILFNLKKDGNPALETAWMNLEDMLNEKLQSQKDKYCIIPWI